MTSRNNGHYQNNNDDNRPPSPQRSSGAAGRPDHGENFMPVVKNDVPNMTPEPLDHFKRGYRERADLRDREMTVLNVDFSMAGRPGDGMTLSEFARYKKETDNVGAPVSNNGGGGGVGGGGGNGRRYSNTDSHSGNGTPRVADAAPPAAVALGNGSVAGGGGGGGGEPPAGSVPPGPQPVLDVQRLVDRLCSGNCNVENELEQARHTYFASFQGGKAITGILSNLARRRKIGIAMAIWNWMDTAGIKKNVFHYNSLISVCEKVRDHHKALMLLEEMDRKNVKKNEVTFSSAISACEKCGQWRLALDLLDRMKKEGVGQTAIAYNAAISACEKGLVPHKALEIFDQMKREGVEPTVVTYSALISAAEKGQQWKLALEVLEEMKAAGHGANVIAYSAAISALSKGQMWQKALELFREIEASGGSPSIVTYNATMTALEKGLQWERALDLFDEMKLKNMPVTVVSYGSAISACEKGLQYKQCLEYLDEMGVMGIKKNVIIFGAAMSCMEKSCRADIAFQLLDRMKLEGVAPNVHIYNSAISACARCNLWEKGYQLFQEMEQVGVVRDVVSYNAVLDAVCSQVQLGRQLFLEGVERGFYARVSRLGSQWLELDLHFLSLGGGEIALGWWFEECLVPYLMNSSKLEAVQSISIVTGYGKTRMRGARQGDDGMRKRVRAMLDYMGIQEAAQPNKGRIHINKAALIEEVGRNGGRIIFNQEGYDKWKEEQTTANKFPDVPQTVRPRFRPARHGEGPPGIFIREIRVGDTDIFHRVEPEHAARDDVARYHTDDRRGDRGRDYDHRSNDRRYHRRDGGEGERVDYRRDDRYGDRVEGPDSRGNRDYHNGDRIRDSDYDRHRDRGRPRQEDHYRDNRGADSRSSHRDDYSRRNSSTYIDDPGHYGDKGSRHYGPDGYRETSTRDLDRRGRSRSRDRGEGPYYNSGGQARDMHRGSSYDRARAPPMVKQEPRHDDPRRRDSHFSSSSGNRMEDDHFGYNEPKRPESTNDYSRHDLVVKEEPDNNGYLNRGSFGDAAGSNYQPDVEAGAASGGDNYGFKGPGVGGNKDSLSGTKRVAPDDTQRPQQPTRGYKVEPLTTKRRSSQ